MLANPMAETIARDLRSAIERLRADIDRVEFWTVALTGFTEPIPDYQPGFRDQMLPARDADQRAASQS